MTKTTPQKPERRPANPNFSAGPCSKHPGHKLEHLANAALGRSHRSAHCKARLAEAIDRSRAVLQLPNDYRIGIVPGSDTGAFEMAMWGVLGARGLDVLGWESFSNDWITDAVQQLKPADLRVFKADYGTLPDLAQVDFTRDVVFPWNGTTSGVKVPNGDWISDTREGLTLCDATSAAFAMHLPWEKLDITTYSWQKVMGSEAAHGMLILSPRAVERLETYTPPWPLPKLFRLTENGKLIEGIFKGETINTPSMLAVEDYIDALKWAEDIGGLPAMITRSEANLKVFAEWVDASDWAGFLCEDPANQSNTSLCLTLTAPDVADPAAISKKIVALLEAEGVAYDINAYRDAPPGLRIWGGSTVETLDLEILTEWLDWAYATVRTES